MNFKKGVRWFDLVLRTKNVKPHNLNGQEVRRLLKKSEEIYQEYVDSQPADEITDQILKNGTLTDKLASYREIASQTPLLSLEYIRTLNDMMKGEPRVALSAMNAAKFIYIKSLLPPPARGIYLRKFEEQPLRGAKDSHLLLFYFEDQLKICYNKFLENVELLAKNQQNFTRKPAIETIGDLLKAVAESERVLLQILVDKFGDPLKEIANVATDTILKLLKEHPAMTEAVVNAIKTAQPTYTEQSQKRALKFLGQLKVNSGDEKASDEMLETAREQFFKLAKKDDPSNSKVLASLMRTIQRCAEVSSPEKLKTFIDPLYQLSLSPQFSTSFPAVQLLYSIHKRSNRIPEKYYQTLYSLFLSPGFANSSKHSQFLNLVIQALQNEPKTNIICSFLHRLLHIGINMNVNFTIGILYLVYTLFQSKPALRTMLTTVDSDLEATYDFTSNSISNSSSAATYPMILRMYEQHYHPLIQNLAETIKEGKTFDYDGDIFNDFAVTKHLIKISSHEPPKEDDNKVLVQCFELFDLIPDFEDDEDEEPPAEQEKKSKNKKKRNKKKNKKTDQD